METTEAVEEFPAPAAPPTSGVSLASQEAEAQVATVAKSTTRPRLPVIFHRLLPRSRLKAVGQYIASFEYSLHPQTNFNSQKQRPLFLILETARTIINSPQPIKCVEAVFVALLLTAGLPHVERFPLSFQTVLGDQVYQHIVLLVQHFGKYGAFGISRWPEFMSKDLKFNSMSSVVENYKTTYEEQHHTVEKIRVGLPVEHNTRSTNFVCWRHLELDLEDHSWSECCDAIDEFAGKAKRLWNLWIRSGRGEDPWQLYVRQTKRLLADRKPSPLKAKRLNSGESSDLTAGDFELLEFQDSRNVNCRFNVQPPSSRESARITLSLEPGEVPYPPKPTKDAKKATGQKEYNRFNKTSMAVRSQSSHGFSKYRRRKKFFKVGSAQSEDTTIRSVKSIKGGATRSQNHSVLQPPVESRCLLRTQSLDGTPGLDGPKTCWECLRTVYQTQNEARLLLLKDKLADLRMQGPQGVEAFRVVQGIFQQLVGIGEAITSNLNAFEETITTLTNNFDAVAQSINAHSELGSLKHLATQLTEELPINTDLLHPAKKKKTLVHDKSLQAKRNMARDIMQRCRLHEQEIVRRVGEYKTQIGLTSPHSSREESKQLEAEKVKSLDLPSGKLVLWHRNRLRDSKLQEQSAPESTSQNDSTDLVAGEDMGPLLEVDVGQFTSPRAGHWHQEEDGPCAEQAANQVHVLVGDEQQAKPAVEEPWKSKENTPEKELLQGASVLDRCLRRHSSHHDRWLSGGRILAI